MLQNVKDFIDDAFIHGISPCQERTYDQNIKLCIFECVAFCFSIQSGKNKNDKIKMTHDIQNYFIIKS